MIKEIVSVDAAKQIIGTTSPDKILDVCSALRRTQSVSPLAILELCKASKESLSLWLYSQKNNRLALIDNTAAVIELNDLQDMHTDLETQASCKKAIKILERVYATETERLPGGTFQALLRVAISATDRSVSELALVCISVHWTDAADMLTLALSKSTSSLQRQIGRGMLPYLNPVFAALEAQSILNQTQGSLSIEDQDFINESKLMWWKHNGSTHFESDETATPDIDAFKSDFSKYSDETFPGRATYMELASSIAVYICEDTPITLKTSYLEEISRIDKQLNTNWAECLGRG